MAPRRKVDREVRRGRHAHLSELRPDDLVSDLSVTPRFGDPGRDLWYRGYRNMVVEVGPKEGRGADWQPGFYRSRVKPKEAFGKLIHRALAAELGRRNVVRVEFEPTIDSQGGDALKIRVVIAPDAFDRLEDRAFLDALVRLHRQLYEMSDDRTPILEYATEAELAEDGGP